MTVHQNSYKDLQEDLKYYGSAFPQQIGSLRPNWIDNFRGEPYDGEVDYGIAYAIAVDGVEFEVEFTTSSSSGWRVTARSHDYSAGKGMQELGFDSRLHELGFERGPLRYKTLGNRKTIKGAVSLARKYVKENVAPLVREAQRAGATLFVPDPEER